MKFQNLSVKRLFGRVAIGLVLSMSRITIALFLVTKQIAVLLTGGGAAVVRPVGIFVLTQAFGKRLSQFTADLCQTLDHMIAGNEAPQRPERTAKPSLPESDTGWQGFTRSCRRTAAGWTRNGRSYRPLYPDISHQVKTPVSNLKMATDTLLEKAHDRGGAHRLYPGESAARRISWTFSFRPL